MCYYYLTTIVELRNSQQLEQLDVFLPFPSLCRERYRRSDYKMAEATRKTGGLP